MNINEEMKLHKWAQASAILYSIVETAKANDLNISEYLQLLQTSAYRDFKAHG